MPGNAGITGTRHAECLDQTNDLPLTALYVCALPYGGQDVGPGQA
jgi:hypothetical protein